MPRISRGDATAAFGSDPTVTVRSGVPTTLTVPLPGDVFSLTVKSVPSAPAPAATGFGPTAKFACGPAATRESCADGGTDNSTGMPFTVGAPIASLPSPANVSGRVVSMFDRLGTTTFTQAAAEPQLPFDASATFPSLPIAMPPGLIARCVADVATSTKLCPGTA